MLASNRAPDSYLAGGTALHAAPNSRRFSNDVDYFHDSIARVAEAFAADRALLESHGYAVTVEVQQPGHIRARVAAGGDDTRLEWAHDSSWRFLPVLRDEVVGFVLHPIDLALNKVLALAGRHEPRDLLDVIDAHDRILPLGALVWAAAGKDPGFSPTSLLELLKRRGTHRPEDFARLRLTQPVDLVALKQAWRAALDEAEQFIASRPASETGCLYYAPSQATFVMPGEGVPSDAMPHYGRPGGIWPQPARAG
ncbi:MAG TPA: nucleotidyl transferase AbiEii/AbiGii toxin family protein [Gemmatimonadaceae bacterium]|nr:nucleotidyl transferase AbiEii/AbiGii toxin family protein [Gemmatimonadaceae bacterium]